MLQKIKFILKSSVVIAMFSNMGYANENYNCLVDWLGTKQQVEEEIQQNSLSFKRRPSYEDFSTLNKEDALLPVQPQKAGESTLIMQSIWRTVHIEIAVLFNFMLKKNILDLAIPTIDAIENADILYALLEVKDFSNIKTILGPILEPVIERLRVTQADQSERAERLENPLQVYTSKLTLAQKIKALMAINHEIIINLAKNGFNYYKDQGDAWDD